MRFHHSKDSDQNFWVSYADLMAGLLFVFILVLGAIVVKYVFIQNDLELQKNTLIHKEKELLEKNHNVSSLSDEISMLKQTIVTMTHSLEEARHIIIKEKMENNATHEKLVFSLEEIEALKRLLSDTQLTLDERQGELVLLQTLLQDNNTLVKLKEAQIDQLNQSLIEKSEAHQTLVDDLNVTKARIKNLTGIRLKVIQELKTKMGRSINIDPNSGAIRLPSSVLFDVGSYEIKPEAKKHLKETLSPYFSVLLENEEIRHTIDKIIIEGHTDSDGSYMNNLELSQKRALSVMAFIYSWDEKRNPLLQTYLSAQGRSYSDRILKKGIEDKEASRRIEIKFSLSNKQAIEEIERFLKK